MSERRTSSRQRSFLQGRVFFNNRRNSVDCIVRDISETGARLTFGGPVVIPDVIDLYIPSKNETYRATVHRRFEDEVGVAFATTDESSLASGDGSRGTDAVGRIHQLEKDVAQLQRKFNELQAEVRQRQTADI